MANTSGDLLVPDRAQVSPAKNKENWMVDPADDSPDHEPRKWVCIDECPFDDEGKCTKQSWKLAKVWSLESPLQAINYLCQHFVHSSHHNFGGRMTGDDGYEAIHDNWHKLNWSYFKDSFEMRETYRQQMKRISTAEEESAPVAKKRRHSAEDRSVRPSDSASNVGSSVCVIELAAGIRSAVKEAIANSQPAGGRSSSSWDTIQSAVATSQPSLQVTHGALPGTIAMHMVPSAAPTATATIPLSKLILIQESLQRSEHAVSSTLSAAVSMSQRMASERAILINAINIVSQFTGQAPRHFVP